MKGVKFKNILELDRGMELEEFSTKIKEAIKKQEIAVFTAICEVTYRGRAESYLSEGERLIIIKQDATLLIHQPKNNLPINYMKEGTKYYIKLDKSSGEERIIIRCENSKYKEKMIIIIKRVYLFHSQKLEDNKRLILTGTEKDMADMIIKNPKLIEENFRPLSREEHTKYGFIDVFGYDKNNNFVVIETKRYVGDLKAVSQLRRYVERIKKLKGISKVRGILACPRITPNAKNMLRDFGFEYKRVIPPKYLEDEHKKQKNIFEF